jgi:osmotically-inducible protein OsmY
MTETDRTLVGTVRTTLNQNPTLGPACRNVYVSSTSGTVTLTGSVPTEQDRQFIENAVRNINGVYQVNDQLQVTGQPTGAADSRIYIAQPTAAANPMSAGNVFNLHVQGLDEPDRTVAQRILHELRTDTILPSLLPMVNITVSGGRVTLEGNVQNEQQRRVIDSAIQRAVGGNNVSDMLQVR